MIRSIAGLKAFQVCTRMNRQSKVPQKRTPARFSGPPDKSWADASKLAKYKLRERNLGGGGEPARVNFISLGGTGTLAWPFGAFVNWVGPLFSKRQFFGPEDVLHSKLFRKLSIKIGDEGNILTLDSFHQGIIWVGKSRRNHLIAHKNQFLSDCHFSISIRRGLLFIRDNFSSSGTCIKYRDDEGWCEIENFQRPIPLRGARIGVRKSKSGGDFIFEIGVQCQPTGEILLIIHNSGSLDDLNFKKDPREDAGYKIVPDGP